VVAGDDPFEPLDRVFEADEDAGVPVNTSAT
jgi:hypothetical protein